MIKNVAFILLSFLLSALFVYVVLQLSRKKSWYDRINERKIHKGDIPRLGGVGFALAFIITTAAINFSDAGAAFGAKFIPLIFAFLIVLAAGVCDDFHPLSSSVKLTLQIIAALCVVIQGYTFRRLFYVDIGPLSDLGWFSYPLTMFWIVGMTNALNFIDGVDGLCGGVSVFAALGFALIFLGFNNSSVTALFCLSLAGALAGFLIFNAPFPKAKIFMGDGGAYFAGFALSLFPLVETGNTPAALPLFYAAAILSIPIFDTISAVWRRIRDKRRVDSPDKAHTHHKLLFLGLNYRKIDFILWSFQIALNAIVFVSVRLTGWKSLFVLGIAYALAIFSFSLIHFLNRKYQRERSGGGGRG